MSDFGRYIKELRKARGLSQKEVSEKANISRSYISHLESGSRSTSSVDVITSLSGALDVDPYEMFARIGYFEGSELREIEDISPLERKLLDVIRGIPSRHIRESTLELIIGFASVARDADLARHEEPEENEDIE